MMKNEWTSFKSSKPPENVVIEATTPTGDVVELVRRGSLMWADDMYIYYTPVMWRVKQ